MEENEFEVGYNARREMERLEHLGLADQEEYMQESSWPVEKIKSGFKVKVCWKYFDEEDGVSEELWWCGGVVEEVFNNKSTSIISFRFWLGGMMMSLTEIRKSSTPELELADQFFMTVSSRQSSAPKMKSKLAELAGFKSRVSLRQS